MDHRIPKPAKSVEDAIFDMVHEVATSENDESLGTLLSLLRDTVQQLGGSSSSRRQSHFHPILMGRRPQTPTRFKR